MIATVHSVGPADSGLQLTREEFVEAEFTQGYRYERFEGKLVAMPPPGESHHFTVKPFRNILGAYELAHPDIIEHVLQDSWMQINGDTDRIPDILNRDPHALNRPFHEYATCQPRHGQWWPEPWFTPLVHAVFKSQADAARLLLDRGAELTVAPDGRTLMEIASQEGFEQVVDVLKAHSGGK